MSFFATHTPSSTKATTSIKTAIIPAIDQKSSYNLLEIPKQVFMVTVNGVEVDFEISGVVLTITTYPASLFEATDRIKVWYE